MTAVMSWRVDQPLVPTIRGHQRRVALVPVTGLPRTGRRPAAEGSAVNAARLAGSRGGNAGRADCLPV
jgi:hypothetical protein